LSLDAIVVFCDTKREHSPIRAKLTSPKDEKESESACETEAKGLEREKEKRMSESEKDEAETRGGGGGDNGGSGEADSGNEEETTPATKGGGGGVGGGGAPAEDLMKEEEMKLKKKFPTAVGGGSVFLHKKLLQRDKKYFDSGDYNMARGQAAKGPQPKLIGKTIAGERVAVPSKPTGESHPSAALIPQRKVSISTQANKLVPSPVAREFTTPGESDQHPLARMVGGGGPIATNDDHA